MSETMIFDSSNDYWTNQKQTGDATVKKRHGWCAAGSAKWVKARLEGKAEDFDPLEGGGQKTIGIMQHAYRLDDDDDADRSLLSRTGVAATRSFSNQPITSIRMMKARPGVYYFGNKGHAMAMQSQMDGTTYWYDIESGLWKYDAFIEAYKEVHKYYKDSRDAWECYRCALA